MCVLPNAALHSPNATSRRRVRITAGPGSYCRMPPPANWISRPGRGVWNTCQMAEAEAIIDRSQQDKYIWPRKDVLLGPYASRISSARDLLSRH